MADQKELQEAESARAEGGGEEAPPEEEEQAPAEEQDVPSYADGFSKSMTEHKVLEIDLDDWVTAARGET